MHSPKQTDITNAHNKLPDNWIKRDVNNYDVYSNNIFLIHSFDF